MAKSRKQASADDSVQHINPDGLLASLAFTQVVTVVEPAKTIYIGGQDAVDATGTIVGKGDIAAQAEQVLKNVQVALEAAGARLEHVIKWNAYVVDGYSLQSAFEAFQRWWGNRPNPPAITMLFVAGLANPDFLLEWMLSLSYQAHEQIEMATPNNGRPKTLDDSCTMEVVRHVHVIKPHAGEATALSRITVND